jgi:hypothetical protein
MGFDDGEAELQVVTGVNRGDVAAAIKCAKEDQMKGRRGLTERGGGVGSRFVATLVNFSPAAGQERRKESGKRWPESSACEIVAREHL